MFYLWLLWFMVVGGLFVELFILFLMILPLALSCINKLFSCLVSFVFLKLLA